jgi:hypothetical protein
VRKTTQKDVIDGLFTINHGTNLFNLIRYNFLVWLHRVKEEDNRDFFSFGK